MATTETITVEMLLASDKFRAELGKVVNNVKDVGDKTKDAGQKTGSVLDSMRLAWLAVAAAVYKVIGFAREAVADATKADRQMRQLAQTYAGMGEEAKRMAAEIGKAFAIQDDDVAALLARLGTLLQNIGLTKQEALSMSGEMVKVGADLAKLWGTDTETAVSAIQSALVGNGRVMRQYGINVDEASIKQQALTMGIWDGKTALTQAQTAMAAMALVTKGAGGAIGETARQWDSFEMQVQRAKVAMQEMKEAVGRGLIAGFMDATKAAGKFGSVSKDDMTLLERSVKGVVDVLQGLWYVLTAIFDIALASMEVSLIAPFKLLWSMILGTVDTLHGLGNAIIEIAHGDWKGAVEELTTGFKRGMDEIKKAATSVGIAVKENLVNALNDSKKAYAAFAATGQIPTAGPTEGGTVPRPNHSATQTFTGDELRIWRQYYTDKYDAMLDANEKGLAAEVEAEQKKWDTFVSIAQQGLNTIDSLMQSSMAIQIQSVRNQTNNRIREIERSRDATIRGVDDALAAGLISQAKHDETQRKVEEKARADKKKTERDAFRAEQDMRMAQTAMAGALAIIRTFAEYGFTPAGIAASIAMGFATGGQIVAIQNEDPPAYERGGLAGFNGPEMALLGERGPELVIPAAMTQQLLAGGGSNATISIGALNFTVQGGTEGNLKREVYQIIKDLSSDQGRRNIFNG